MARDHARVNVTMWGDPDLRALPYPAQLLYLTLWTAPGLSYCGVHDWRPGRLAARSQGMTAQDIELAAQCLEARHFLVIDRDTEECLIRSWARFDGLMKQPRMAVSFVKAYSAVESATIKQVLVHELGKIREESPELGCWSDPRVGAVLDHPGVSAKALPPVEDPFGPEFALSLAQGLGLGLGQTRDEVWVPPTPAPTPTPLLQLQRTSEIADAIPDTPRDDVQGLCDLLADSIEGNGVRRPQITKRWHDAARLLLDKDKYTIEQVEWMIRWATSHEFWRANILSMPKLREKFDQMRLQATGGVRRTPMADAEATLALAAQMQADHDRVVGE